MKIGNGVDVHKLVPGRRLVLGGKTIPYELGLEGHSDADVLTHAIMDALLGAAKLGDIGKLFPDTDPTYAGADSLKLLHQVTAKVNAAGLSIEDIDSVICAQAPKLAPHISQMRKNLAQAMGITTDKIGIKATTTEHLGFEGRGEGISVQAVCLLATNDKI